MSKVKCKFCKDYFDKDDSLQRGLSYFCTEAHYLASIRQSGRKVKHVLGPSDSVREAVLNRDRHVCSLCGVFWKHLHIHHVRYRSEGGAHTQDNLLTLCDDCHREVHSDKKVYQDKCLELIKAREAGHFYLLQDILDDE